jgi:hypothetical protein
MQLSEPYYESNLQKLKYLANPIDFNLFIFQSKFDHYHFQLSSSLAYH